MDPDHRIKAIEEEFPLLVRTILGPDADAFLEARPSLAVSKGDFLLPTWKASRVSFKKVE